MSAFVIDLRVAEDLRDAVHRGVEALGSGKIIALPTETVYGLAASALDPVAVDRLVEIKGRDRSNPLAFAIKSLDDALDYVPDMPPLARRVARRCWPGPVTLVVDGSHPDSVIQRLPQSVRDVTIPNGTVGLRVPAHEVALQILRLSAGPMVLTSANLSGDGDLADGDAVIDVLGDQLDLILVDGKSHYGQPSSVVKFDGDDYQFLRSGVVDEVAFKQLTGLIALVVCTGNTCRSPMGQAILQKIVADRLECDVDELPGRGITVVSAGVAAMAGGRPSNQAVEVMKKMGMEIAGHLSQPISHRLAQSADVIFAMTRRHREAIIHQWPEMTSRVHTVMRDGSDVSDPIGMSIETYSKCARQIETNLKAWVDELDFSGDN